MFGAGMAIGVIVGFVVSLVLLSRNRMQDALREEARKRCASPKFKEDMKREVLAMAARMRGGKF